MEISYGQFKDDIRKRNQKKILKLHGEEEIQEETVETKDTTIRLNKFIAGAGICSRREADRLISDGRITVNGVKTDTLGSKISEGDTVELDNTVITGEKKVYVLLNKPKNFITTADDPENRKTVMQLVQHACEERIFPVGRLDRNTTGVLLFTNDGDLAKKLTHPGHHISKVYDVELDKPLEHQDLASICKGVTLPDGKVSVDKLYHADKDDKNKVTIDIHSGQNRIVRRIFAAYNYKVRRLDRISFAGLTKKQTPRGSWRLLSEKEVGFLKMQT